MPYVVVKVKRIPGPVKGMSKHLDYMGIACVTEDLSVARAKEKELDELDSYMGIVEVVPMQFDARKKARREKLQSLK